VQQVPKVTQEPQDHKVLLAQQVVRETPGLRDYKVLQELLVHLVLQA
jgi:hypothetical protein